MLKKQKIFFGSIFFLMLTFFINNNVKVLASNSSYDSVTSEESSMSPIENIIVETDDSLDDISTRNFNTSNEPSIIYFNSTPTVCDIHENADFTGEQGYINSASQRDAIILQETDSAIKVRIAGLSGWLNKEDSCVSNGTIVPLSQVSTTSRTIDGVSLVGLNISRYQTANNRLFFSIIHGSNNINNLYAAHIGTSDLPVGLSNNSVYYSYDGIYFYNNFRLMYEDYNNNTTINAVNNGNPHFDYYQYLPLVNTSTNLTGENFNNYLLSSSPDAGVIINESHTENNSCSSRYGQIILYDGPRSVLYNQGNTFIQLLVQDCQNIEHLKGNYHELPIQIC